MGTLLFPAIFLVFGVLMLWILIGCKGWWFAKFSLMNVIAVFILLLWRSLDSYTGWPTEANMPEPFRLVGFYAQEPRWIFLLVENDDEDEKKSLLSSFDYQTEDTVRLHKLPYDKNMHENLEAAAERIMKGGYVVGTKKKIFGAEELRKLERGEQDGSPNADANSLAPYLGGYNFYVLPPALFMKKPAR